MTDDSGKRRLMIASLRYLDAFLEVDGAWLFSERLLYVDLIEERPLSQVTAPQRLVIVGATGMVDGYALRYALEHPGVRAVTAIGRTVGISHPKLREVLHRDFSDCSTLAEPLSGQNAVVENLQEAG